MADGVSGPSIAELGLTQKDLGIKPPAEKQAAIRFDETKYSQLMTNLYSMPDDHRYLSDQEKKARLAEIFSSENLLEQTLLQDDKHFITAMQSINRVQEYVKIPRLNIFFSRILAKNLPAIENRLSKNADINVSFYSIDTISHSIREDPGNARYNHLLVNFINTHLAGFLNHPDANRVTAVSLCPILNHADDKESTTTLQVISKAISDQALPTTRRYAIKCLARLNYDLPKKHDVEVKTLIESILERYHLDPFLIRWSWFQSSMANYRLKADAMAENLNAIIDLENERPGICKVLNQEFGIEVFRRYPKEILIKQYDEKDRIDLPYGVYLQSVGDHNEAYSRPDIFGSFAKELEGKYRIRIIESSEKQNAVELLAKLRKAYGLISFAIIAGHGTETEIQLSGKIFGGTIKIKDTAEKFLKGNQRQASPKGLFRYLFKGGAPILLESCSTGASGGIGQHMSELGVKITAPKVNSNKLRSIAPVFSSNGEFVDFHVYSNTPHSRYYLGQEVSDEMEAAA